jgi:ubiquinone/menaquinone biosynthesis C-methylase UbiE
MPNGKVVATDISPKMLQIARTRATSFGLNGIMEFRESDGEKIELPEQTANLMQFSQDGVSCSFLTCLPLW